MEGSVFDRIEKKYIITEQEKQELEKVIKKHMTKDDYHKSDIVNLYFDNDNFEMISESIDWVDFKKKIRARSYEGYDRVFIEIKTKIHGTEENIGYKRRVMITHKDFKKLIDGKKTLEELAGKTIEKPTDLQIAKEIDYLISMFDLKPKIFISYQRGSYKNSDSLRITFDENLRFRKNNLSLKKQKNDKIFFKDKHNIIMEIKASSSMPLWLVHKLSELKIYPRRFSKIGKVYQCINNQM